MTTRTCYTDAFVIHRRSRCLGVTGVAVSLAIAAAYGIVLGVTRERLGLALTSLLTTATRSCIERTKLATSALAGVFAGAGLVAIHLGATHLPFVACASVATISRSK